MDNQYLYKEEWVARPDTHLEDLPQAQPYSSDVMLIPGEGSVSPFMNSLPDAGMPKGSSPSRRAQRGRVVHPLCGVPGCVHWPDWEVSQAACQWTLSCLKNGDIQTFALAEHVLKTHAVDLSQSEVLDQHQHTTTCRMFENWYIQQNQTVLKGARNPTGSVHATSGLLGMYQYNDVLDSVFIFSFFHFHFYSE